MTTFTKGERVGRCDNCSGEVVPAEWEGDVRHWKHTTGLWRCERGAGYAKVNDSFVVDCPAEPVVLTVPEEWVPTHLDEDGGEVRVVAYCKGWAWTLRERSTSGSICWANKLRELPAKSPTVLVELPRAWVERYAAVSAFATVEDEQVAAACRAALDAEDRP